ncbi:unnamed protein product [Amoebophrya sp. A25]|nr:unnamed protein product [Amoebophrya sp. A25]|eukprot:GSA25T00016219001.1
MQQHCLSPSLSLILFKSSVDTKVITMMSSRYLSAVVLTALLSLNGVDHISGASGLDQVEELLASELQATYQLAGGGDLLHIQDIRAEAAWKQRMALLLAHPERFSYTYQNCVDLLRAAEFTQYSTPTAWSETTFVRFYTTCVDELRLGRLHRTGGTEKKTVVNGIHFPTILTTGHHMPPVSGTFQERCWPSSETATLTPEICCREGATCFDDFYTYEACCLGQIRRDVSHAFLAPANDMNVGNAVRHWGTFDMAQSYGMQSLVEQGDLVIDVGANIGGFTVPLAERVGENGKVLSFEPFRVLFQQLTANVAINGLANVFTFQEAVGSKAERVSLYQPDLRKQLTVPSAMRVSEQYEGVAAKEQSIVYDSKKETVDVRTLDQILDGLREKGILDPTERVKFLKIDVEFMELEVVKGATKVLQVDRPRMWVENESFFDTPSNRTFVDFLKSEHRYDCKPVTHLELFCHPEETPGLGPVFGNLMREVNRVTSPHDRGWAFSLGRNFAAEQQVASR